MCGINKKIWVLVLFSLFFLFDALANGADDDDYSADPPARTARIRFVNGDARIKRLDSDDWEKVTDNLPLVEGDEIETGPGTRLEIQFSVNTYFRVDKNSSLKLASLGDEGIAISLLQGTVSISVLKFETKDGYFEIDAPKTTIAILREGKYRIDAGNDFDKTVKVAVFGGGNARVYSTDSGFRLINEQSAIMDLEGPFAGRWEVSKSLGPKDDFDTWAARRDQFIDKNLRNAYYGRYYDTDIYGADDLNGYGSWRYTNNYGYIWTPYRSSTARYANWSPYRYGHWRWLPYYGWTWVNDEPWGWATYHYGRWIFVNGYWAWAPYSYYSYNSPRRSWWRPAIVYIGYVGNSICWYPLGYNYSYYDYNRRYRNRWRRWRRQRRNSRNDRRPSTRPTGRPGAANVARGTRLGTPTMRRVPATGVVSAPSGTFGRTRRGFRTPPLRVARQILSQKQRVANSPPLLPDRKPMSGKTSPDILIRAPRNTGRIKRVRIGVVERKAGIPLDQRLKRQKILGNRAPVNRTPDIIVRTPSGTGRKTGAVKRTPLKTVRTNRRPIARTPRPTTSPNVDRVPRKNTNKAKSQPRRTVTTPPIYRPRKRPVRTKRPKPTYSPPPRRSSPPTRRQPRRSPPVRRSSPPARRSSPPKRSAPVRRSPPTRTSRPSKPPARSKPKSSPKPARKTAPRSRKKTG